MEYWVDCMKAVWKPKGDQVGAQLCNDLVRPKELVSKLLRQSVVQKNCSLTLARLPIGNTGAWVWLASAGPCIGVMLQPCFPGGGCGIHLDQ